MGVSDKIKHGASVLAAGGAELHFGTFTLADLPGGRPESDSEQVDRLMAAWRTMAKGRWWREHSGEFFRVVERGSMNGRPHVHIVAAGRLPHVPAIRRGEKVRYWRARIGPDGRAVVAMLERAGLGPVCHIERLQGGGAGAATYLGGYLSKHEKELRRPDGRTIRVAESSRGWPRQDGRHATYQAGEVRVAAGGLPCECIRCGQEREEARRHNSWSGVRRLNVTYWLRHVDPRSKDAQDMIRRYVHAADRYKLARARVPPDRRHAIDSGGGGLDVCEAVLWQNKAAAALNDIRSMGYDGSIRLLRDLQDSGFSVERIIE